MKCSNCGREISDRIIWRRAFPDIYLCEECLKLADVQAVYYRNSIAHVLHDLRLTNRFGAILLRNELRGTGVPINPRRSHGKR